MSSYLNILIACLLFVSCVGKKQPNVILIVTDDQGWGDVGFHGNTIVKTPRLDAYANDAVELTNFHTGTTCSPTRAGIMTGRNANRNGAWHTIAGASILNPDEQTLAQVFKSSGYRTAMLGKWHLGDSYPYRPHDRGFDEAFYHGGGGVQQTPDYWNNDYFDDTYFRNGKPEKVKGYCTDVWFQELINFVDKSRNQPFFAYIATNAAHGPFNVPMEYRKMYEQADLKPNQLNFYGMLSNLDDNFGKLVDYLKANNLYENTILIYTTDNGTAGGVRWDSNENRQYGYNPLRGTKGSHYDGGHKVPFLISWPAAGLKGGKKIKALTAHVDLLPTLASLSHITFTPKKPLDGIDVSRLITSKNDSIERMLVIDTQRGQWPVKYKNPCVMQGPWRLVNHTELYNTSNDIGQKQDLAQSFPDKVKAMQDFYDAWWASTETDWKHSPIYLGSEENPVMISIHDMHPYNEKEPIAWNQNQIRTGAISTKGYYEIKVEKPGKYQFNLSRWPIESKTQFNKEIKAIIETPIKKGLNYGNPIIMKTAHIKIGDSEIKEEVNNNRYQTSVEVHLTAGNYQMEAWFYNEDNQYTPAYYIETEFLN